MGVIQRNRKKEQEDRHQTKVKEGVCYSVSGGEAGEENLKGGDVGRGGRQGRLYTCLTYPASGNILV